MSGGRIQKITEITDETLKEWREEAESELEEGMPVTAGYWPSRMLAMIDAIYELEGQRRMFQRQLNRAETELLAYRGKVTVPPHVLANLDAIQPHIEYEIEPRGRRRGRR